MFVERCCLFSSLLNMHIDLLKRYFEFGQRLLASGVRVRVRLNVNQAARVWRVNQPQADRQTAVGWLPPRLAPGWPLPFPTPAPIYPKDLVPFPWTSCQMCIRPKRTAKRGGGGALNQVEYRLSHPLSKKSRTGHHLASSHPCARYHMTTHPCILFNLNIRLYLPCRKRQFLTTSMEALRFVCTTEKIIWNEDKQIKRNIYADIFI